ncbi:MAG TPA: DUF1844 domain-containing protein [Planctomycetota bacterium]|nr:DUF1844 domain-containing protein [Planctomycetota bacterium]HZJ72136.1 DUF1844 domain-containing protein [Planctomycetota bacterium]
MSPLLGPDGQPLESDPTGPDPGEERQMPEVSFNLHVFHLASQVGIALGETENPLSGERSVDLAVARFLIDTLAMLEEKTRGNRTQEEELYMQGVLTNLRMAFVSKSR